MTPRSLCWARGVLSFLGILSIGAKGYLLEINPMSKTLTASDRSRLIKLANTLPAGSPERKSILKGLGRSTKARGRVGSATLSKTAQASFRLQPTSKTARFGKLTIEVDEDRSRISDTYPKGQPYVEFSPGNDRYYLVRDQWRSPTGQMPMKELAFIAHLIYAGKLR